MAEIDHVAEALADGEIAWMRKEFTSAAKHFERALRSGLTGAPTVMAHSRAALAYEIESTEEGDSSNLCAVAHAEAALVADQQGEYGVLIKDRVLRHLIFSWLDGSWTVVAERIEEERGVSAALEFLQSRMKLVEYIEVPTMSMTQYWIADYLTRLNHSTVEVERAYHHALSAEIPFETTNPKWKFFQEHLSMVRESYADFQQRCTRAASRTERQVTKKSDCWIAGVIYGESSFEVRLLQNFRDTVLQRYSLGKFLVRLYYYCGPVVAYWLSKSPITCSFLRQLLLDTLVQRLKRSRYSVT